MLIIHCTSIAMNIATLCVITKGFKQNLALYIVAPLYTSITMVWFLTFSQTVITFSEDIKLVRELVNRGSKRC
jgi:hypothetical protein